MPDPNVPNIFMAFFTLALAVFSWRQGWNSSIHDQTRASIAISSLLIMFTGGFTILYGVFSSAWSTIQIVPFLAALIAGVINLRNLDLSAYSKNILVEDRRTAWATQLLLAAILALTNLPLGAPNQILTISIGIIGCVFTIALNQIFKTGNQGLTPLIFGSGAAILIVALMLHGETIWTIGTGLTLVTLWGGYLHANIHDESLDHTLTTHLALAVYTAYIAVTFAWQVSAWLQVAIGGLI